MTATIPRTSAMLSLAASFISLSGCEPGAAHRPHVGAYRNARSTPKSITESLRRSDGEAALHALEGALPLRPGSYWSPTGAEFDSSERRRIAANADRLADELTRFLRSDRPDWGFAFLVGIAPPTTWRDARRSPAGGTQRVLTHPRAPGHGRRDRRNRLRGEGRSARADSLEGAQK